jgi:Phosphate-selective porin O and P
LNRRISLSISLRHSAVLSALLGTVSANAWADPPAKPAAPAAPAPAVKVAVPATKAAEPAAKAAAPVAPKPHPKAAAAPPKAALAVAQPVTEAVTSKEEVAALRSEAKGMREDLKALRADLNHAIGAPAVTANQERAEHEVELAEARKKRAAIQAAVDGGLDRAAVADSITSTEARIAQLEAALAKQVDAPTGRSLAEISADVKRLDAAVAKREPAAAAGAAPTPTPTKPPPDTAPSELTVSKTGFFQPSANLQLWATASHLANDATPNESWTNMLRIRRAELKIKGEIVRKTFGYMVMFDPSRLLEFSNKTIPVTGEAPAPATAGSVSVAQPTAGGASSILQDVALSYLSDYADVSIGQFKIPVSLEGSGSAAKLYFPERALISRKYGDRRDLGVKAEKKFAKLGYTLGLYNGEGQNKLDSNDQKDLSLRLEAYPIKDVTLAIVGYTGLTERSEAGTKDRVEGDVKLEKNDFLLQAEYIRGWDMTGTPAAHKRIQGQGFYVLAGYTCFEKLQPVVRVGSLDPEIGHDEHGATAVDPNDETTTYELGANYYFKGNDAKLQLAGSFFDPEQRSQHTRFDLTLAAQLAF